jgi:hypothetical protein
MMTIRACTGLAAAILAGATAATLAITPAFADPPARSAAPKADPKADPKAEKKADKPAAPAPDKIDKADKDRPAKRELVSDADARRFSEFFDKLVAIVVATQDDCVKMAAGINGHLDANQALIDELNGPKNQDRDLPPAIKERVQKKARDELTPAIVKKCSTDKGVEAAFKRMGAGRGQ